MRASSIAVDEMCLPSLRDCMAYVFGMRVSATAAVLYCVAVGIENRSIGWCSPAVAQLCACRLRFREDVTGFRFFCGPGCCLVILRLYILSCCCCTLWVVVVPHFSQPWSRPRASFRSRSHLTVCMCSVSSMLMRVGCLCGAPWRCRWSASLRRSSVSAAAFRSSQTLWVCCKHASSSLVTNVGISRVGVPLATASAMLTWLSMPMQIAVRCSGVASPLKPLWMDAGVSGSGAAKTGCWMSRCSCAYVVTCRNLVISLTVSISCAVQLGDVWMYIVSGLVVLLVPFGSLSRKVLC
jgi:hypothetical protein